MAHTWPNEFLKASTIETLVGKIETTDGSAADNSTIARYNAGALTSIRNLNPGQVQTSGGAEPLSSDGPDFPAWRQTAATETIAGNERITISPHRFAVRLRYRRSGQFLEVNQDARITVVLYRYDLNRNRVDEQLGITQTNVTFTTTVQTVTLNIDAAISDWYPDDVIWCEITFNTLNAGVPTPPAVATDLWLTLQESDANSGARIDPPDFEYRYKRSTSNTITTTNAVTRRYTGVRALTNTAAATNTLTRIYKAVRALANTASVTDSLARAINLGRLLNDTANASDAITRLFTGARAIADTAAASDTVARRFTGTRQLADTAPASDLLTRLYTGARSLADTIAGSDLITRAFTGARSLADAALASDTLTRLFTGARSLAETISGITNTISRRHTGTRQLTDAAPAADTITRLYTGARTLTDTAAASDAITRRFTGARTLTESIAASDTLTRIYKAVRNITDLAASNANQLSANAADIETDASAWTAPAGTLARSNLYAYTGSYSLEATKSGSNGALNAFLATGQHPVATPGESWTVNARVRAAAAGTLRTPRIGIRWLNSGGGAISTSFGNSVTEDANGFILITHTATAPAGTAKLDIQINYFETITVGEKHYIDTVEATPAAGGTTSDAITRRFTGARTLSDTATAADALTRILRQVRFLVDNLAGDGSGTITEVPIYIEEFEATVVEQFEGDVDNTVETIVPEEDDSSIEAGEDTEVEADLEGFSD